MELSTDWIFYFLIPALLFVFISGGAVVKSRLNGQINWYYALVLNFLIGVILAMFAAIPLGALYLIFFQKKKS